MNPPGLRANAIPGNKAINLRRKLLLASLLFILVQACRPASITPIVTGEITSSPTISLAPPSTTNAPTATVNPSSETPEIATLTPGPTENIPTPTATLEPTRTAIPAVVFAAIGDYGSGNHDEEAVANLILSWQPDFIITLGDNNYPSGEADHMDEAVGQFFHSYIYPYLGSYEPGAEVNRFFPCLGNHDLLSENGKPYFDYFSLPGNERYYDFVWGPLHLYALNSNDSEPDGVGASSAQAAWLKESLAASTSTWNIVYMHYPPYSSGLHGSVDWTRWPYAEWGADAVLSGHDHTYERLEVDGIPYFVNGLGGGGRYDFEDILDSSLVRYNRDYGAMRVEATELNLKFEFINIQDELIDEMELCK